MLADDHAIALFFEKRVPDDVYSGATFEAFRARAEADDPKALFLSLADVLVDDAALSLESFPDTVSGLQLSYRFDPGEDDDGITVTIPIARLLELDPAVMEHTIPGWHREKIFQLLPPEHMDLVDELADEVKPFEGPFLRRLVDALRARTGEAPRLALAEVSPHLRFRFRLVEGPRTLAESKDLRSLQERFALRAREAAEAGGAARR
jgi:ATP-dependent helicase HrpA